MSAVTALKHNHGRSHRTPINTDRVRAPINRRALIARIRRELGRRGDGQDLKVSRAASVNRLGEFYLVQAGKRDIVEGHIDLEILGRRLGVLETWEFLEK